MLEITFMLTAKRVQTVSFVLSNEYVRKGKRHPSFFMRSETIISQISVEMAFHWYRFHKPTIHNLCKNEIKIISGKSNQEKLRPFYGTDKQQPSSYKVQKHSKHDRLQKNIPKTVLFSFMWGLSYQGFSASWNISFYSH